MEFDALNTEDGTLPEIVDYTKPPLPLPFLLDSNINQQRHSP